MQIVLFRKSIWKAFGHIPDPSGFIYTRLGRVEIRLGRDRIGMPWGRPKNDWAYDNG